MDMRGQCSRVCVNPSIFAMFQVFPMVVGCLPLKKDHEENETVYQCICQLYQAQHQEMFKLITPIMTAVATELGTNHIKPGEGGIIERRPLL